MEKRALGSTGLSVAPVVLPEGYSWAEGRFRIGTLDQLTARDLHESQVLDVNFLSGI